MPHGEMRLQLTHGIQHNADHDQQTGAAEELGNHKGDPEAAVKHHGKYRKRKKEHRTAGSDSGHGTVEEIGSGLTGTDSGDESTLFFQVIRNLQGVELICHPEETEGKNQNTVDCHVTGTILPEESGKSHPDAAAAGSHGLEKISRDHHDCSGKDDGHDVGKVDFKRHVS